MRQNGACISLHLVVSGTLVFAILLGQDIYVSEPSHIYMRQKCACVSLHLGVSGTLVFAILLGLGIPSRASARCR